MSSTWTLGEATADADPGNPERYPVDGEYAGMGGAGIALGTTPWLNLAGLGRGEHGVSGSVSAYGLTEQSSQLIDSELFHGTLESTSLDLFPSSLSYVRPLADIGDLSHGIGLSLVIPDFDQFDGNANIPAEQFLLEIKGYRRVATQTFWVVSGWGGCIQQRGICFGIGPAFAIHKQDEVYVLTLAGMEEAGPAGVLSTAQSSSTTIAMGGQVAVQAELSDEIRVGVTLRSPVRTVSSFGSVLNAVSRTSSDVGEESYVDRVEIDNPYLDYRRPMRLIAGLSYENNAITVAFDAKLNFAQSRYQVLGGPNREVSVQPNNIDGSEISDPSRALSIGRSQINDMTLDVSAGVTWKVNESILLQTGVYSDFSSTPSEDVASESANHLSRVGFTLGLGLKKKRSTSWATIVAAFGSGETYGLDGNFEPINTNLDSRSILFMLGTDTLLDDE